MDPKACLECAKSALFLAKQPGDSKHFREIMHEHLCAYSEWRKNGGFEPENGDETAAMLWERLNSLPEDDTEI